MARAPGSIRDAIVAFLETRPGGASVAEIRDGISEKLGSVAPSSVRSYLNINVPGKFERVGKGEYRLKEKLLNANKPGTPALRHGTVELVHADCFEWLEKRETNSIHAVVTDPPYGLVEYTEEEQAKLRRGKGGVWRIPPSFDGHKRAPLPRFTVLSTEDHKELYRFFRKLARQLARVVVPGGNIIVASNPLLCHIVASAMWAGGLEMRGYIARLTMTMRGGDRPKNAHEEFQDVSVMPRSMWEPWVVLRRPLEGRVQDTLRKWKTGGFRRPDVERPFGDVIRSNPTPKSERDIAPHPSLKPQEFLRAVVRGALPLGHGVVLDPFAGSGSTLAAATAIGYSSIGIERSEEYFKLAWRAIPQLAALGTNQAGLHPSGNGGNGHLGCVTKGPKADPHKKSRGLRRERNGGTRRPIL